MQNAEMHHVAKKRDELQGMLDSMTANRDDLLRQLEDAIDERDKAIRQRDEVQGLLDTMTEKRDILMHRLCDAGMERDEAIRESEGLAQRGEVTVAHVNSDELKRRFEELHGEMRSIRTDVLVQQAALVSIAEWMWSRTEGSDWMPIARSVLRDLGEKDPKNAPDDRHTPKDLRVTTRAHMALRTAVVQMARWMRGGGDCVGIAHGILHDLGAE